MCQQNLIIPNTGIHCVVYQKRKQKKRKEKSITMFFLVLDELFAYLSLKKMRTESTTEENARFQLNC